MTNLDLTFHPAHNRHCRLHFHDGSSVSGVFSSYFDDEPERLYLVRSNDLLAFKPLMEAGDAKAMRPYCIPVDPALVKDVELL